MGSTCAVQPRILIADDQPDLIDALRLLLKGDGIDVEAATSPEAALTAISSGSFDLLLMDLNYTGDTTSGREGIDLLARVRALDSLLPVIVMTGWGSVDLAVEAMRRGVRDFVQKPWDNAQLLTTLRTEIEQGRARRQQAATEQRELAEALRIQRKLLPSSMPVIDGWEVSAAWQPASGVGGDCYDAISFGPSRLGLSIADVVGKGIPAALLMSNLQASVRAFATAAAQPAELCQQVNRILCGHIAEGRFISFFYCVIDNDDATLTYANAGHYPPILLRADGTIERLHHGGPVLGVFPDGVYEQGHAALHAGDRVILYTDGITEARRLHPEAASQPPHSSQAQLKAAPQPEPKAAPQPPPKAALQPEPKAALQPEDDDEFGEPRLIELAIANRACSAPALQARLTDAVASFTGGRFHDDSTLIVMAAE